MNVYKLHRVTSNMDILLIEKFALLQHV